MTVWFAVAGGVATIGGAALANRGAEKNADAIEAGSELAARTQQQALDASLTINRPTQRLGNSAQRQLAALFGLPDPGEIEFDSIQTGGSNGRAAEFDPTGRLNDRQQASLDTVLQAFGRDPIADPDAFIGLDQTQIGSRFRNALNQFKSDFGYDPTTRDNNPLFAPPEQEFIGGSQTNPANPFGTNLSDLINDNPGVQFVREQGEQALARGAAARGLNASGGALKDLARFNQGQASTNYQNLVLNPLFQLAGFGQQANAQSQNAITGTATNQSNLALGAADARGSAYQSGYNALGSAVGDIGGAFALRNLIGQNSRGGFDPAGLVPYGGGF